jgi:hypothetical protein
MELRSAQVRGAVETLHWVAEETLRLQRVLSGALIRRFVMSSAADRDPRRHTRKMRNDYQQKNEAAWL